MNVVFLDRDGVINRDPGDARYVMSWAQFRFLPHAKKAIALLKTHAFRIYIISNQAGVGRGLFSREALDLVTQKMIDALRKSRGDIDGVFYCTHKPEDGCGCRKPQSGLFKRAKQESGIEYRGAFFVGDTMRDVKTAKQAGLKSILVLGGKEKLKNRLNWDAQPDFVFRNLFEAAKFIVKT